MMSKHSRGVAIALSTAVVLSGCATGGGGGSRDQMSTTVYATHRIVRNLEQNLGDSVTKLNETAAGLQSRVEQTEEQSRRMQGIVEENQMKLDRIQSDLSRLSDALYRHLGLSTGVSSTSAADEASAPMYVPQSEVVVEQPSADTSAQASASPQQTVIPSTTSGSTPVTTGNAMDDYKNAQQMLLDMQYADALNAFESYLNQYPNNSYTDNAQFWKAQCLLKLERYREAVMEYDKAIGQFPDSDHVAPAHYYKGLAYLRLGQTSKGVESLQYVLDTYPDNPAATRARAVIDEMNP